MTIRIYQLFLISIFLVLTSCASTPNVNLLEALGNYDGEQDMEGFAVKLRGFKQTMSNQAGDDNSE